MPRGLGIFGAVIFLITISTASHAASVPMRIALQGDLTIGFDGSAAWVRDDSTRRTVMRYEGTRFESGSGSPESTLERLGVEAFGLDGGSMLIALREGAAFYIADPSGSPKRGEVALSEDGGRIILIFDEATGALARVIGISPRTATGRGGGIYSRSIRASAKDAPALAAIRGVLAVTPFADLKARVDFVLMNFPLYDSVLGRVESTPVSRRLRRSRIEPADELGAAEFHEMPRHPEHVVIAFPNGRVAIFHDTEGALVAVAELMPPVSLGDEALRPGLPWTLGLPEWLTSPQGRGLASLLTPEVSVVGDEIRVGSADERKVFSARAELERPRLVAPEPRLSSAPSLAAISCQAFAL